jgi:cytochrome c556
MRNLKFAIGAATLAAALGAAMTVSAQTDVIKERQTIMKGFGAQARDVGAMVRGTTPYDAAKAASAVDAFSKGAQLGALFPANSQSGDTAALPAIWTNRADFDLKLASFNADVAAAKGAVGDETAGKASLQKIMQSCGGCHMPYRKPPPPPAGGAPGGPPGAPGAGRPPG